MRLLHRYLLKEFITPLVYCLGGFLIFGITFQLFGEMDDFQQNEMGIREIALYFVYTIPELLGRVVPVALLLAMLYALSNHARHNEISAMRCAGISLWRISIPYFLVSMICGFWMFAVNEFIMPDGLDRAEVLMQKKDKAATEASREWHRNLTFFAVVNGRTNIVGPFHFNLKSGEMARPRVLWFTDKNERMEINAERGVFSNGNWNLLNAQVSRYQPGMMAVPDVEQTNLFVLKDLTLPPRRIHSEIKINRMSNLKAARGVNLSLAEIVEYQRWHPELANDPRLNTKFHLRLAAPCTCLVIVMIALPFGAVSGRRNVFVAVSSSVFLCFAYFILLRFGEAVGMSGRITPWVAGWLPNIIFAFAGMFLALRLR